MLMGNWAERLKLVTPSGSEPLNQPRCRCEKIRLFLFQADIIFFPQGINENPSRKFIGQPYFPLRESWGHHCLIRSNLENSWIEKVPLSNFF